MEPRYRKYYIYKMLNDFSFVEDSLKEIISYDRGNYTGYSLLFDFLMSKNREKEGFKLLSEAKKIFGELDLLKLDLTKAYLKVKEYKKATEIIDTIENNEELYSDFQVELSKIKVVNGKLKDAIELLENNFVYNEENDELLYLLGIYNLKLGDFKESSKYFSKLEEKDSDNLLVKISYYLNAYSYKFIEDEYNNENRFRKIYNLYKIQSLSNPYDVNIIIFRILTLIELKEYRKVDKVIFSLSKINFEGNEILIEGLNDILTRRKNGELDEGDMILNFMNR